ncbi:MAG: VanZ family protein [Steroidobacteraceae bacterium]
MKPVVLTELRYRRAWMAIGIAMLLAITIVCLMPSKTLPETGMSDKSEHALAFGAVAFWFGSIVMRYDVPWLALLLVGFGALIEVSQAAMGWGRSGDVLDLLADSLGIALGIGIAMTPLGRWARWVEVHLLKARA